MRQESLWKTTYGGLKYINPFAKRFDELNGEINMLERIDLREACKLLYQAGRVDARQEVIDDLSESRCFQISDSKVQSYGGAA